MKLYVLEAVPVDQCDYATNVIGVYSSIEIAEAAYASSDYYGNNENYYSNITEVFLDREII